MAKDINEYLVLNKEEQILVNKLNKNLSFLAEKTERYFQQEKIISPDMIREAFIFKKDYLKINQEALQLIDDWEKSVGILKNKSQENYDKYQNQLEAESFIFNESIDQNLEIVLNTIDNLGKLYLKKDKIKVLNQLRELLASREKGYTQSLKSIFEKYDDSLMILKQILEDNQLLVLTTNQNDFLLLSKIDKLEVRWKVFDNKWLLIMVVLLFLVMIISIIIAICVMVIVI